MKSIRYQIQEEFVEMNTTLALDYLETSLSKDELLEVINHLQKIYDKK